MTTPRLDVAIVGGGIVGLATALMLSEAFPGLKVGVLEKEAEVGQHQTGHNSGVIHAGIYYKPGSFKAKLCSEGRVLLMEFCQRHEVPFEICGKLIVATGKEELPRLQNLLERATANGIPVKWVEGDALREIEPHAAGLAAIHSPGTGIVDYGAVTLAMKAELMRREVSVMTSQRFENLREGNGGVVLETTRGSVETRSIINCGGLHSDRIARRMGLNPDVRIVPFRGEYYFLKPERRNLVRGLIYPVPDPELPFLGVHLTRTVHGKVDAGPNAVLALAREGYRKTTIHPSDLLESITYPGFWKLARRFMKTGAYEYYRSFSKTIFARDVARLLPELTADDLVPGGAGVRAQAVGRDGKLVDDFLFAETPNALHVLNAPSPAATASLAIGRAIVQRARERFGWKR